MAHRNIGPGKKLSLPGSQKAQGSGNSASSDEVAETVCPVCGEEFYNLAEHLFVDGNCLPAAGGFGSGFATWWKMRLCKVSKCWCMPGHTAIIFSDPAHIHAHMIGNGGYRNHYLECLMGVEK